MLSKKSVEQFEQFGMTIPMKYAFLELAQVILSAFPMKTSFLNHTNMSMEMFELFDFLLKQYEIYIQNEILRVPVLFLFLFFTSNLSLFLTAS